MKVTNSTSATGTGKYLAPTLVGLTLLLLFWRSFVPGLVHFSNDGPLGAQKANFIAPSQGLTGMWDDLNSVGVAAGSYSPSITLFIRWALGPVGYAKLMQPVSLLILGIGAGFFFRRLGLASAAVILGALAAALNSDFFSIACWGLGSMPIAAGMTFLACGLIMSAKRCSSRTGQFVRLALAGLAVGMGIMEAADNGALLSLMIAGYVMCVALAEEGALFPKLAFGSARIAVVAVFAAFIAAHTIFALVGAFDQGTAGTEHAAMTKAQRWDWATQWSMPREEALGIIVPGLFGYRMDTPDGGNYWGMVGSDPAWEGYLAGDRKGTPPAGYARFSGTGTYAGVAVVVVAFWAALQSFRRSGSVFGLPQRRLIWFWTIVVIISLLLSFGRFAPFYQLVYALPGFSTIRNPIKFLHLLSFALLVLFAYGVDGLWRTYMQTATAGVQALGGSLKSRWAMASRFDRRWIFGCLICVALSLVGWKMYSSSHVSLEQYLQTVQFDEPLSKIITEFSIRQVGWFVFFLVLATGLLTLIFTGMFRGPRARWGGFLLGLVVCLDLARADLPWIKYWDYTEKYATNPIIEMLRSKPFEHRVAFLPFQAPAQFSLLDQLYRIEWAQHHFMYYNIQSLDVVQMPRPPGELMSFENALHFDGTSNKLYRIARRWELTNTRYFLGAAGFLEVLNREIDPVQHRFRIVATFDIVPKPNVTQARALEELTAVLKPEGPYALFEFTGALPRAKLYSNWEISTNGEGTLNQLSDPKFDPAEKVLVCPGNAAVSGATPVSSPTGLPLPPAAKAANPGAGSVEFSSYAPKAIVLKCDAPLPSVLLLNDCYDPNWKVFVDGKPELLLRCNFIMRGVYLTPGKHKVEFRFQPPIRTFYVAVAALGVTVLLCGLLLVFKEEPKPI